MTRSQSFTVAAGALVACLIIAGQNAGEATTAPEAPTLSDAMKSLSKVQRKLRRQISDPAQRDSALALVGSMQASAAQALVLAPPMAQTLPEGDRAAFLVDYKRTMLQLLVTLVDLEAALVDGNTDAAATHYRKLGGIKKVGHQKFQEQEE